MVTLHFGEHPRLLPTYRGWSISLSISTCSDFILSIVVIINCISSALFLLRTVRLCAMAKTYRGWSSFIPQDSLSSRYTLGRHYVSCCSTGSLPSWSFQSNTGSQNAGDNCSFLWGWLRCISPCPASCSACFLMCWWSGRDFCTLPWHWDGSTFASMPRTYSFHNSYCCVATLPLWLQQC